MGRPEQPLRHQVALMQSLDTALAACGLSEPATVEALRCRVREAAEAALAAVLELEASLSPEQRGGRQAQTDVLGKSRVLGIVGGAPGLCTHFGLLQELPRARPSGTGGDPG